MASVTEKLSVQFYLILISLNVKSHTWLMAILLDSTALGHLVFDSYSIHHDLRTLELVLVLGRLGVHICSGLDLRITLRFLI